MSAKLHVSVRDEDGEHDAIWLDVEPDGTFHEHFKQARVAFGAAPDEGYFLHDRVGVHPCDTPVTVTVPLSLLFSLSKG